MKIISVFNNKGGVGKSTLTFHLAHALVEKGHKTLMIDLDPQSNLTLNAIAAEQLEEIWEKEDPFIEDSHNFLSEKHIDFQTFLEEPRSIHSLLKPIEDGIFEISVTNALYLALDQTFIFKLSSFFHLSK